MCGESNNDAVNSTNVLLMLKDLKLNPFFVHSDARSDEGEGDVVNVNMLFFKLSRTQEPNQGSTQFTECVQFTRNPVSSVVYRFSMNYSAYFIQCHFKIPDFSKREKSGCAMKMTLGLI